MKTNSNISSVQLSPLSRGDSQRAERGANFNTICPFHAIQEAIPAIQEALLAIQEAILSIQEASLAIQEASLAIQERILAIQEAVPAGVFTELCLPYIFLEKIYTCLLGYFH